MQSNAFGSRFTASISFHSIPFHSVPFGSTFSFHAAKLRAVFSAPIVEDRRYCPVWKRKEKKKKKRKVKGERNLEFRAKTVATLAAISMVIYSE